MHPHRIVGERQHPELFDRRHRVVDIQAHDQVLPVGVPAARRDRQLEMKIAERLALDQFGVGGRNRTRERRGRPRQRIGVIDYDVDLILGLPETRDRAGERRPLRC